MQIANILIAVGGDSGNTVPRYEVTPSEVAVLRVIHGEDAVTEVQITGDVKRVSRAERERLAVIYGGTKDENQNSILTTLFPGIAARMFETFEELGLPEDFYKAERGTRAPVVAVEPTPEEAADAEQAADHVADPDADDGIGEMNDSVAAEEVRGRHARKVKNVLG